ncbi:MAG: hypothetical protein RR954_08790, partial [Christensenellaceae bacterium]
RNLPFFDSPLGYLEPRPIRKPSVFSSTVTPFRVRLPPSFALRKKQYFISTAFCWYRLGESNP